MISGILTQCLRFCQLRTCVYQRWTRSYDVNQRYHKHRECTYEYYDAIDGGQQCHEPYHGDQVYSTLLTLETEKIKIGNKILANYKRL